MNCPHCGGKTVVLETRGTTRTRQCVDHKEHRFVTNEVVTQYQMAYRGSRRSLRSQVKHWQHLQ